MTSLQHTYPNSPVCPENNGVLRLAVDNTVDALQAFLENRFRVNVRQGGVRLSFPEGHAGERESQRGPDMERLLACFLFLFFFNILGAFYLIFVVFVLSFL